MGFVGDIWKASRGQVTIEQLLHDHGFHGPLEGELSGRVWREDPEPLRRLIADYAARDDRQDPIRQERERQRARAEMARSVVAGGPRWQRPLIRALLSTAAKGIRLRGVAKRSFLQGLDVARASARRAGALLAAEGTLAEPDDVFYLTYDELTGLIPADVRDLVSRRRARRAEYEQLTVPDCWRGMPEPAAVAAAGEAVLSLNGVGVSSGVAEGTARVVLDPDFTDIEPGEILVTRTTNPSWASVMFVSSALVVDVGGALSHAAVVARELGLPCVVGCRIATRSIRTGDRIRVDGDSGTVEILEPTPDTVSTVDD